MDHDYDVIFIKIRQNRPSGIRLLGLRPPFIISKNSKNKDRTLFWLGQITTQTLSTYVKIDLPYTIAKNWKNIEPKVSYFFFPDTVHGPFIQSNRKLLFFLFSREAEKKKNYKGVFFFPKKSSWTIHSGSGGFFLIFFENGVCFFCPDFWVFFVCFFFLQKFICHSFNRSRSCIVFFFVAGKKITAFSFI